MNREFTAKLLRHLNNKKNKNNKGFTLIELLVVVIIIGVLAAVALPNLLAQVGKARETEGKNAMGTINRTEQSYHFENKKFSDRLDNAALSANNPLGVIIASKYFDTIVANDSAGTDASDSKAFSSTATKNGIREYTAGIEFSPTTSAYNSVLCQGTTVGTAPSSVTVGSGTPTCGTGSVALE
jgi:type IV pilus assembly protein PilA